MCVELLAGELARGVEDLVGGGGAATLLEDVAQAELQKAVGLESHQRTEVGPAGLEVPE